MSESKTIGVRMAKASTQDLDAAFALAGILESLGRGYYPTAGEAECEDAPTHFDSDNMEHLQHLHGLLCNVERSGSLFRVAGGLATLLSEANAIIDPDDDCISLHPRIRAAINQHTSGSLSASSEPLSLDEGVVEAVARAICKACDEDPDHSGDARGNEYRWQDYRNAAVHAITALKGDVR